MSEYQSIIQGVDLPPNGTQFYMKDYMQVSEDEFASGHFTLLSVKIKKTKKPERHCKSISMYMWEIKTKRHSDNCIVYFLNCAYVSNGNWRECESQIEDCNTPNKKAIGIFFSCGIDDFIDNMEV